HARAGGRTAWEREGIRRYEKPGGCATHTHTHTHTGPDLDGRRFVWHQLSSRQAGASANQSRPAHGSLSVEEDSLEDPLSSREICDVPTTPSTTEEAGALGTHVALAASKPDDVVHFKPRITGLALHVVRFGLRMDPFFFLWLGSLRTRRSLLLRGELIAFSRYGGRVKATGAAGLNSQRAEIIRTETKRFNKVRRFHAGAESLTGAH
ncbi:hypothetical protein GQ607_011101, partial [Colletotrichum asianum]